jgi:hypothetical protein
MRSSKWFKIESTRDSVEIKAGQNFATQSSGDTSIKAGPQIALQAGLIRENSGGAISVSSLLPIYINTYDDTKLDTENRNYYVVDKEALRSIVNVAPPTHEPYGRPEDPANKVFIEGLTKEAAKEADEDNKEAEESNTSSSSPATASSMGGGSIGEARARSANSTGDATKTIADRGIKNAATDKDLRDQPQADGMTVGDFEMNSNEMTAYKAQMGRSESGGDYTEVNQLGYVGKYQMGHQALIDEGYVKSNVGSNGDLNNPNSWTGKGGIRSKSDFLNSPSVQESAMDSYTKRNYKTLVRTGGITSEQTTAERAGMMSASHLLGAGGATQWRETGIGSDANNTTGAEYYKRGVYSQQVLAGRVNTLNVG